MFFKNKAKNCKHVYNIETNLYCMAFTSPCCPLAQVPLHNTGVTFGTGGQNDMKKQ